ncbi:hypothetical protein MIND_00826200 [Mycena indigotica]|uniref:Uncharacterized protein n=1 Tax=Mycena indigotica TaxID=2126181 RepID=A0A8H6W0R1_9AGAR|nr:uncharacterized protein MIND_00826200 [Mycena indigotica]KAF7298786.1 hypothetical protein MIND_00826200 [Mycena indigotica]
MRSLKVTFEDHSSFPAIPLQLPRQTGFFQTMPSNVDEISIQPGALYRNRLGDGRRCHTTLDRVRQWGRDHDEFEPIYAEARSTDGNIHFYLRLLPNAQHATQDRSLQSFAMYEKAVCDAEFHANHLRAIRGHIIPRHYGMWFMDTGSWAGLVLFTIVQWCGVPYRDLIRQKEDSEELRILVGRTYEQLHDYGVVHAPGGDPTRDPFAKVMFDVANRKSNGGLRCYVIDFSEAQAGHYCQRKLPILPLGTFIPSRQVGCREVGGLLCLLDFSNYAERDDTETPAQEALEWHTQYHNHHPGVDNALALVAQRAKMYAPWPEVYKGSYKLVNPESDYPEVVPVPDGPPPIKRMPINPTRKLSSGSDSSDSQ